METVVPFLILLGFINILIAIGVACMTPTDGCINHKKIEYVFPGIIAGCWLGEER